MLPYILDNYIMEVLLRQKAEKMGLSTTDEKIKRYIQETQYFINPVTGKYDPERLKMVLRSYRMSFEEFEKIARKDLLINDFRYLIAKGAAVSSDDAIAKYMADNSKIKIRYSFLSNADIEAKHKNEITVSDKEIDKEIASRKDAVKDPKTAREKIKNELKLKKTAELRKTIAQKIDAMAAKGASFSSASQSLGGKTGESEIFKLGGNVKNAKKGEAGLSSLAASDIFRKNLMKLKENTSSPAFDNGRGIMIFTRNNFV